MHDNRLSLFGVYWNEVIDMSDKNNIGLVLTPANSYQQKNTSISNSKKHLFTIFC